MLKNLVCKKKVVPLHSQSREIANIINIENVMVR